MLNEKIQDSALYIENELTYIHVNMHVGKQKLEGNVL